MTPHTRTFQGHNWGDEIVQKLACKAVGITLVAAIVGGLFFGHDVYSYARTAFGKARSAVKSEVPIEFEIDRARDMVEALVHDVRECMHVIAEQQVDVEHMEMDLERRTVALDDQRSAILARRHELASGDSSYVHAGVTYSEQQIERDLASRFERYKVARETLERDRQLLAARREALTANQDKLDRMLNAKRELEVEIEQLEARVRTIAAAESVSDLQFDDSRLSRAKSLIRELDKQLDVRERLLDAEGRFTGLIPVAPDSELDGRELGREIDDYFGSNAPSTPTDL